MCLRGALAFLSWPGQEGLELKAPFLFGLQATSPAERVNYQAPYIPATVLGFPVVA